MEVRGRVTAISGCAVAATFISTCGTTGSEWGTTIPGIPVPQNPIWHLPNGVKWYCNSGALVLRSDPVVPAGSLKNRKPASIRDRAVLLATDHRGQRSAPDW
ncbi:hypothetical protein [Corynebacterium efficiens YS-314]|uniref:Uncharacterized protein n=1 Tax=Corynebacterium efficiens (strain DSM 44549 / YS-314 / AJ 12310 / JCM 11189 / NBRC 100395) TaxID=196164 RepID=Q8FQ96_COREF|nr:hypothetical protein [Corynebacterium efficiens YS-314]